MAKAKQKSPLWELQNREDKNGVCEMCHYYGELTVDHIFPQSILSKWGLYEEISQDKENMQLICRKCQILKKDNFDFHDVRTIPLIEKYIELLKSNYNKS